MFKEGFGYFLVIILIGFVALCPRLNDSNAGKELIPVTIASSCQQKERTYAVMEGYLHFVVSEADNCQSGKCYLGFSTKAGGHGERIPALVNARTYQSGVIRRTQNVVEFMSEDGPSGNMRIFPNVGGTAVSPSTKLQLKGNIIYYDNGCYLSVSKIEIP